MRVMVVGPLGPDDFADNVRDTLTRMGHEVHAVGAARPSSPIRHVNTFVSLVFDHTSTVDQYSQRHLVRTVERVRPDVLLTMDRRLHRSVIHAAQSHGARTALWFPDAVSSMGRHDMFLNGYDRIYLKNPVLVQNLQSIYGLPVRYLPEACNSTWHRSAVEYGTDATIVMAGNIHPTRALLIKRLLDAGLPVRLYGGLVADWVQTPELAAAHTGQYLARAQKADVFRRARVVLNNLHPAEFAGANCRLFEACGSGGLVLTEIRPGLTDLFQPGRELDTFTSFDELREKLEWYVADPEHGRAIADQGAKRARSDHTYEHRLAAILEDLA
jgi:spore maturation protein CgeB